VDPKIRLKVPITSKIKEVFEECLFWERRLGTFLKVKKNNN